MRILEVHKLLRIWWRLWTQKAHMWTVPEAWVQTRSWIIPSLSRLSPLTLCNPIFPVIIELIIWVACIYRGDTQKHFHLSFLSWKHFWVVWVAMDMPIRDEARGMRLGHHFDRTTQPEACPGTRLGPWLLVGVFPLGFASLVVVITSHVWRCKYPRMCSCAEETICSSAGRAVFFVWIWITKHLFAWPSKHYLFCFCYFFLPYFS